MVYKIYILYSSTYDKIYIGYTSDLAARLLSHNELGHKGWTIRFRPWELVHTEEYRDKSKAMLREKQLKTARGRAWVRELVKDRLG